jgi:hypothetical protein
MKSLKRSWMMMNSVAWRKRKRTMRMRILMWRTSGTSNKGGSSVRNAPHEYALGMKTKGMKRRRS